jgi:hypothetical protein
MKIAMQLASRVHHLRSTRSRHYTGRCVWNLEWSLGEFSQTRRRSPPFELAASACLRKRLLLERVELGRCDRSIVEQFLPLGDLLGRIAGRRHGLDVVVHLRL